MEDSGRLDFGAYNGNTTVLRSAKSYNDNQWHHVVGTQSSAGMRFYVDGVLTGRNTVADAQTYLGTWHVGGDNLNGWPSQPTSQMFAGSIDETAVYDTALSGSQVAGHYEASGRTVATSGPTDAYGKAVVASEPDLFWRLDETTGNTAADSSTGGGNTGTIGSGVQLGSAGKVGSGKSVTTGGSDALVVSPQTGSSNAFSVEAWIKTTTTDGGKIIGFEDASSGNGNAYDKQIYMAGDGTLLLGAYDGSTQVAQSAKSYNDGTWHHVVGTQNGGGMKLYVDGAVVATNAATTNQGFNGYWRIGGGNLNYWPSQPNSSNFAGQIDEAAVYSTALSATEVATHYNAG